MLGVCCDMPKQSASERRERWRQYNRIYRAKNAPTLAEKERARHALLGESHKQRCKTYHAVHAERLKEVRRAYYQANKHKWSGPGGYNKRGSHGSEDTDT